MRARYSSSRYHSPVRKVSDPAATREQSIETVIESLGALWGDGAKDVPDWAAHELTFGQMRLLFLLKRRGPSPMSHVADWLGVGLPAASGIVERVERHGFVARSHRQDDRRIVECCLTDTGHELIAEMAGLRHKVMRQFLEVLSDEELAQMTRLVKRVVDRTQEREGASNDR